MKHVLLVDDDVLVLKATRRLLDMLGFEVTATTNGHNALQLLEDRPHGFDLVMTDMEMPGINGIQLASRILRAQPGLPVIVGSGLIDDNAYAALETLGVRHLRKPYDATGLAQILAAAQADGVGRLDADRTPDG